MRLYGIGTPVYGTPPTCKVGPSASVKKITTIPAQNQRDGKATSALLGTAPNPPSPGGRGPG